MPHLSPEDIDLANRTLAWIERMQDSEGRFREGDHEMLEELALTLGQYHGMKMRIQELTKLLDDAGITYQR
jgi:hypothetical protein